MTATRSEKLKRRRGRPRSDGPRTDSGQLSRSKDDPPDMVARMARVRMFGVTYEESKNPDLSLYVGRLRKRGDEQGISSDQYMGIMAYLSNQSRYTFGPDSLARSEGGPTPIFTEEEQTRRRVATVKQYEGAMKLLIQLQHSLPHEQITQARSYIEADFKQPMVGSEPDHLIGAIRLIGNALRRYYKG